MWSSILCLSFISAVSAAPASPFFNYLPHFGNPAGPSAQPAFTAPISMEIVFPPQFPGAPVGGASTGPGFPTQAFIKYSLPKAPGAQSIEIYYPYDFSQNQMLPPIPPLPGLVSFDSPAQNPPQQSPPQQNPPHKPPRAGPAQSSGPQPPVVLHDQAAQTGQTPTHP